MLVGDRLRARLDLVVVSLEMVTPALCLDDHRLEAVDLLADAVDLAVDPGKRVAQDRLSLRGVARRPEPLAVAGPGRLVL